jgi:integrase
MVQNHIGPVLAPTRLSALSALQLAQFERALGEGVSPRRVRMVHDLLHKVLVDAVRLGLIQVNVADAIDPPRRVWKEKVLWDPDRVGGFVAALSSAHGGWYSPLLLFLLASGCRVGEALGLRWSDVDLDSCSASSKSAADDD